MSSSCPFFTRRICWPRLCQVYVWGRRHQYVNLSFLGIFNFTAPYLPWVLLGFSIVLGSSPVVDLLGMVVGEASAASCWHARDCALGQPIAISRCP